MIKFSLIILTYNSDIEKIILTIKSILEQDLQEYEIIISDDGSKTDFFEYLRQFFLGKGIDNYKLIKNNKNIGIVKNLLEAIRKSNGKYIKALGPGDLLFSNDTLSMMFEYLTINKTKFAFGKMKSYCIDQSNNVQFHEFTAPKNLKEYKRSTKKIDRMIRNLLIFEDWISGITMFFNREYVIDYLLCLADECNVKYCEDLLPVLILLDNDDIGFYDQYIVWYEYGMGISSDNKFESSKLLRSDHEKFLFYLKQKFGNNKIVQKAIKLNNKNNKMVTFHKNHSTRINNTWLRRLLVAIYKPYLISFKIDTYLQKVFSKKRKIEKGFLIDIYLHQNAKN